ncbi:hypothetical protein TrispH2_005374 [Trichoplax sp. H2]|nr:hypothetical protein TrispH2_005374 [Trichoplax sp. H2]|eukprot:RDD43070.1 hypothetical protein TrispH2_005374 [Trichoplax sp. H2]
MLLKLHSNRLLLRDKRLINFYHLVANPSSIVPHHVIEEEKDEEEDNNNLFNRRQVEKCYRSTWVERIERERENR